YGPYIITFIHSAYPNYSRVTGSLCLSQASLGIKAGYTLDGVPTHRRAHTHSHSLTQSHTTDNLETPINLQCMSLDRGRKPEYPEETPEAQGEHAYSTHGRVGNQTPNPGGHIILLKEATAISEYLFHERVYMVCNNA
ncbi:hypothetical protein QTP86_020310, partial [Hemibagrus guttatus]